MSKAKNAAQLSGLGSDRTQTDTQPVGHVGVTLRGSWRRTEVVDMYDLSSPHTGDSQKQKHNMLRPSN